MENLIKTLYFDYKIFKSVSFLSWIQITLSKYKCLLFILWWKKNNIFKLWKQKIIVSSVWDIGTTISSLSDEYFDLYTVIEWDVDIIVDVGSNIWQFTNAVHFWYPKASIHSFEPDPQIYNILTRNTSTIDMIIRYNLALAETEGVLRFYIWDISVMSSLIQTNSIQRYIEVKTWILDTIMKDILSIDILKIDVEWAELMVLKWWVEVLKKSRYLLIEMSFKRNTDGIKNLDIIEFVRSICPRAELVHIGRALWNGVTISAQDFLIKLNNQ